MSISTDQIIPKLSLAIAKHKPVVLLKQDKTTQTTEFNDALFVKIDNEIIDITTTSDYKVNETETNLTLKDIVFCWLNKDTPSSDYIQLANSKDITTLTFGQRTKLISLLSQTKEPTESSSSTTTTIATKKQKVDPVYEKVKAHEREVANDYRGQDDFSYLIKLSQVKIVEQLKHKPSSSSSKSKQSSSSGNLSSHHDISKDPIIILSPAASSILNLSNISKFLQESIFEPPTISTNSNGIVKIKKQTKFGPISFLLIDNTDKFFNKPDYWKRVVAIFTTGQKWQFKNYQISDPSELFRNYPGFYANNGEPVPKHVKEWGNINVLDIDKYKRFRDKQIVESFWGTVERYMTYKGYGAKK